MSLYELVFIGRQDMSSSDLDKLTDNLINILKEHKGELIKQEYWGFRNLAYEIAKNKKGHYVMLGISANNKALQELDYKMKFSSEIIRYKIINVKEISKEPSPILKTKNSEQELTINVTN